MMKFRDEFSLAHEVGKKAGINFLEKQLLEENYTEAKYLLGYYQRRKQHETDIEETNFENESNALFREAYQMEYIYVQDMLEQEKITKETSNLLKEQITYDEMVYVNNE